MALKPVAAAMEFYLISVYDPAVDLDASDVEAYKQTGDMAHIKMHEGESPTVFECRAPKASAMLRISNSLHMNGVESEGGHGVMAQEAFRYGVRGVRNLQDDNGHDVTLAAGDFSGNPRGIKLAWVDDHIPWEVVLDIGALVIVRSRLSEEDAKNS